MNASPERCVDSIALTPVTRYGSAGAQMVPRDAPFINSEQTTYGSDDNRTAQATNETADHDPGTYTYEKSHKTTAQARRGSQLRDELQLNLARAEQGDNRRRA